jgi:hypothetical protein
MDLQSILNPLGVDPLALVPTAPSSDALLDAASRFPGGPVALVFVLFWSPWMAAIGIPAGLLLARHAGINPAVTIGLYALSDVMGAMVTHPTYALLRKYGSRSRILSKIGRVYLKIAMFGVRMPRLEDVQNGPMLPALFRIGVISFGFDIYHGGMVIAGLPVPRLLGWLAALIGDLLWFSVLMATNSAAAAVIQDDRTVAFVTIAAMLIIPKVAEWIFPALRMPDERAKAEGSATAVGTLAVSGTPPLALAYASTGTGGGATVASREVTPTASRATRATGSRPRPRATTETPPPRSPKRRANQSRTGPSDLPTSRRGIVRP